MRLVLGRWGLIRLGTGLGWIEVPSGCGLIWGGAWAGMMGSDWFGGRAWSRVGVLGGVGSGLALGQWEGIGGWGLGGVVDLGVGLGLERWGLIGLGTGLGRGPVLILVWGGRRGQGAE